MSKIIPTIGRKVWFYSAHASLNVLDDTQPMDATIVFVQNELFVNLLVSDHMGHEHRRIGVRLIGADEGPVPGHVVEYACWMPYQVGQAKKDPEQTSSGSAVPSPSSLTHMVDERAALKVKVDKLAAFTDSESYKKLAVDDRGLLLEQLGYMRQYSNILLFRIDRAEQGLESTTAEGVV